ERGHRGHRGHEGPTGPTGPTGSGSTGPTGATGPTGTGTSAPTTEHLTTSNNSTTVINPSIDVTFLTEPSDADGNQNSSLADGPFDGFEKKISTSAPFGVNVFVITPANLDGGTSINI